jgi:DNA-binding PadR family transcriptional regulator
MIKKLEDTEGDFHNLDLILRTIYKDQSIYPYSVLQEMIKGEAFGTSVSNWYQSALDKLEKDGYLKSEDYAGPGNPKIYQLTYDGILFHVAGGYKEMVRREKSDREFEERKQDLELQNIQMAIQSNKSVVSVNRLFWAILAATVISALATCGNLILSWRK